MLIPSIDPEHGRVGQTMLIRSVDRRNGRVVKTHAASRPTQRSGGPYHGRVVKTPC